MKIKIFMKLSFLLLFVSCTRYHCKPNELTIQPQGMDEFTERKVKLYYTRGFERLAGCDYLKVEFPNYYEILLNYATRIVIENRGVYARHDAATIAGTNKIVINVNSLKGRNMELAFAHEILHVIGINHGIMFKKLEFECGLKPFPDSLWGIQNK